MTDAGPYWTFDKLSAVKMTLTGRLSEHEKRARHIKVDLDEPVSADFSEQAVEMEDDESLEAQGKLVMQQINALRAAIERVDQGCYGECLSCGAMIQAARLAAIPEATLCIECASRRDKRR